MSRDYVEVNFFEDSWDEETETDIHEPVSTDFTLTAAQIQVITDAGVDLVALLMGARR
jgi:hypothetical protein